jgi:hypothetical protein
VVRGSVLFWLLAVVAPAMPAAAETSDLSRRVVYEAAFFSAFSPANALQMIQRVPGFTLDEGDSEVRGFSQAAGNVVINGRRPSAKSETLETLLARIPASRVLRVELASGEQFGSDYAGKSQVANLVLTDAGGFAGTVEATVRRDHAGGLLPEGSVSALIRHGASTFNLSARVENRGVSEEGYDRLLEQPGGGELELREKRNRYREPKATLAASWSMEETETRSAHVNASLSAGWPRLSQTSRVTLDGGAGVRDDTLYLGYFDRTIEIGADVTRPLAGGGLKLLGIYTREYDSDTEEALEGLGTGQSFAGVSQQSREWHEERVARLSWTRSGLAGWTVELGGELAHNRLRGLVALDELGPGGVRTRIDLPIDDAVVSETRFETFAGLRRAVTRTLNVDLGLNFEASDLAVTGDVTAGRSLRFLKPKATLDWRAGAWHAQLNVRRTVAQLDFSDFVSAADVSNDRIDGGNAELLPQRAWETLVSVDRTILGDGRIKLDLGYDAVSLVQDRVPTPEGFDAPGNLGSGSVFSAVGNLDLPLKRLGVRGGRLSLYGSYVKTSVRDPYTLLDRAWSGFALFYYEASFRQDLGRFAWGMSIDGSTGSRSYRRDEVDYTRTFAPDLRAFVEYRPTTHWTVTLGATNLLDQSTIRHRDFYLPDRSVAAPRYYEYRERNEHVVGYLTIKRSLN